MKTIPMHELKPMQFGIIEPSGNHPYGGHLVMRTASSKHNEVIDFTDHGPGKCWVWETSLITSPVTPIPWDEAMKILYKGEKIMTTKPSTFSHSANLIAESPLDNGLTGAFWTLPEVTCDVCHDSKVSCLTIDSSNDDLCGYICAKCLKSKVLPLIDPDPDPEAKKRYDELLKIVGDRKVLAAEVKSDVTTHSLSRAKALVYLGEFIKAVSARPLWDYSSGTIWLEGSTALTIDFSGLYPVWGNVCPPIPAHLK